MGFALGAMAGCSLGATEDPVEEALVAATGTAPLQPVLEGVGTFGALGLGTLLGATALTLVMTSVVAGVILAAAVASLFVSAGRCGRSSGGALGLGASAGVAGAFGTTLSGATLGVLAEWIVGTSGMMGLLGAVSMLAVLKPPLKLLLGALWERGEASCSSLSPAWEEEQEQMEARELQHRQRAAAHIERKILALERGGGGGGEDEWAWLAERRRREEVERRRERREEAREQQQHLQDWIHALVAKHVDFLAFSGIPMTVVAVVTSGFGLLGYGNHPLGFVAVLVLVSLMASELLKASNFQFWMMTGCMAMFITFIIAVLTLHAGQLVVTTAMKNQNQNQTQDQDWDRGQSRTRDSISAQMRQQSCVEALSAAFFAARLCQLALGATVGGPLGRYRAGGAKVVVGAALVAVALLGGVRGLSPVLGEGGKAGALLGAVGATGVAVGAAAALCGSCSSWGGTLATAAGLVVGAVRVGRWHLLNLGLQLPVAFVFARTTPF